MNFEDTYKLGCTAHGQPYETVYEFAVEPEPAGSA